MAIKLKLGAENTFTPWRSITALKLKLGDANTFTPWRNILSAFVKTDAGWKRIFGISVTTPEITSPVEISKSTNSTTKLITLTGTNYKWNYSTGLTYEFNRSVPNTFDSTLDSGTITNPTVSNTKTYLLTTTDVLPNQTNTFTFKVIASNSTYNTEAESSASTTVEGVRNITDLTNNSATDTSLSFSWLGGAFTSAYVYQYQTYIGGEGGTWSSETATTNNSVSLTGLSSGVTYKIRVKGITGTTVSNPGYSGNFTEATGTTTVSAPTNTSTPTIARNAATNYIYSVTSNGGWTGSPTSYNYQWYYYRSLPYPPNNEYTLISGATSSSYTTNASYVGYDIYCAVSAVNAGGTSSAVNSNFITITAALSAPSGGSVTLSPAGTQNAGTTLTASTSGWSGSPTSYSIGIYASTSNPPSPGAIGTVLKTSSTSSSVSYTITTSDATSPSYYFKAFATASNSVGTSDQVESNVVSSQIGVPSGGSVTLTGTGGSGTSLTATTSGWSGSPTTYSVAIYAGTTAGTYNVLKAINSPTSSNTVSYTITTADASPPPYIFIAYATATNSSGTSSQVSSSTITSFVSATPPTFTTPPYFFGPPTFTTPPYFVVPPYFVTPPYFVVPPYFTDPRK
jgi:trimeric autotransporter adhesin